MNTDNKEDWRPPEEFRGIGIRTVDKDFRSYGGFQWPRTGYCEAPDWDPIPDCGKGLHFLPYGIGDFSLLDTRWHSVAQVIEYDTREEVSISGLKSKVPRCNVLATGTLPEMMTMISRDSKVTSAVLSLEMETRIPCMVGGRPSGRTPGLSVKEGMYSIALVGGDNANAMAIGGGSMAVVAGNFSHARSGGASSSAVAAGVNTLSMSYGTSSIAACTGNNSKAIAVGPHSCAVAAEADSSAHADGIGSTAVCTKMDSSADSKGVDSISAALGHCSRARAGERGCIILSWFDNGTRRTRITVGYVGENGIKADTWYCVDREGKLIEEEP